MKEKDINGLTVVHYASQLGYVSCLKISILHGADITQKDNSNQSVLHFSATYGRYNSCLHLLNSNNFKNYLNEKDFKGILFITNPNIFE